MFSKAKFISLLIILALGGAALSACSTSNSNESHLAMAPMDQMPMDVQSAPAAVREAYQFNAANPDIMQNIPCYCGCGDIGHTSNYDCYVSDVDASGKIIFDNHALGCSICVDITQDVMRMLQDGKTPQDARAYIDATYSKYGPSNIP
ncbi:MAG: PCYCGC motif-containing (lipo)protein [Anaerolineales bacterium]